MAISGFGIGSAIKGQMALLGLTGRDTGKLASAAGNAVFTHVVVPNVSTASVTGTAGPLGTIIHVAVVGIVPVVMSGIMKTKAASFGWSGRDMGKLFTAISNGLSISLSAMQLTGTVAGCAVGGGTSRFYGLSSTVLSNLMKLQMTGRSITGRDMSKLCDIISSGVVTHLKQSATFTITVAGAVAPVPPTGPIAVAGIPSVFTKIV